MTRRSPFSLRTAFIRKVPVCVFSFVQALCFIAQSAAEPAGPASVYYSKLYVQTTNGVITNSSLEMLPAGAEFRMEKFARYEVTSRYRAAGDAHGGTGLDPLSEARHRAISKVLIAYGLKSIQSRGGVVNSESQDITVLNYEGVVKVPCRVIEAGFLENQTDQGVNMEVWFAPIAFPSEWSTLYWKTMIRKSFSNLTAFFLMR